MLYSVSDRFSKTIRSRLMQRTSCVILIFGAVHSMFVAASAAPVLSENFADGNPFDNDPARWVTGGSDRLFVDETGLFLESIDFARAGVQSLGLTDISVRTRVSVIEGGVVGIASRWQPGAANGSNYYGGLGSASSLLGIGGTQKILADGGADVDLSDVMLQLDVIEDQIDFWFWTPGEMMPEHPSLSATDPGIERGDFYIWGGGSYDFDPRGPVELAIRYVEVADRHIMTGDFNRDGKLDIDDLNALTVAFNSDEHSFSYDVNDDLVIDNHDREAWVKQLKGTYFGDANLDGEFNSGDLVTVFQAGEYEDAVDNNSSWGTGDWNGDGDFLSSDLIVAFTDGGYQRGEPKVAAVPEPTAPLWPMASLIGFPIRRRLCR